MGIWGWVFVGIWGHGYLGSGICVVFGVRAKTRDH